MEREEATNPGLSIWVVEYDLYKSLPALWKLIGFAFDEYHGFGDKKIKSYEGEAALLSVSSKISLNIIVSTIHFSREGFRWVLEGTDILPKPPFLLTSNESTEVIFDGYIEISEDQDVIDLEEPDDYFYAVSSKNWFGIIHWVEEKLHLIAFTQKDNSIVSENDELWTFEWDCPVGRLISFTPNDLGKQR
jgi:hypothetical protein